MLWLAILSAAAAIIIFSGRTPSRLSYEVELERADKRVRQRQRDMIERFKIGQYDRFDWSQSEALIVFSTDGIPKVVADIQFVGSYSDTSKTWLWAWANDSIESHLTRDSERVKTFGAARGFKQLTDARWSATENDGWQMAFFQADLTDADMAYRTPFEQGKTYFTLKNIRWAPPGSRYAFVPAN